MRTEVKQKFDETMNKLSPLINALNKATPFMEVFNAITNIFGKRRRGKENG